MPGFGKPTTAEQNSMPTAASTGDVAGPRPTVGRGLNVVFIPSVSGGLGHLTRATMLARALAAADPSLHISFALSAFRLRHFNVKVARGSGFPVRVVPDPSRQRRDRQIGRALGEADVIIEDTERRMIGYRRILPRLRAWISVPMLPLWDELFMEWPFLAQVDHILWAYPEIMPPPGELSVFSDKLTVTGPIVDAGAMPSREAARKRLRIKPDERLITYAPRGFPSGEAWGRRVLGGVVHAVLRLRETDPRLRLVLTAAPDLDWIQSDDLPPLDRTEGITVKGIVPADEARTWTAAADVAVVEGTSALFDAAVACTPVLMVPGPIYETWLEGMWLHRKRAGVVEWIERVTPERMTERLREALEPEPAAERVRRLRRIVGSDGPGRAVEAILDVIDAKVGAKR